MSRALPRGGDCRKLALDMLKSASPRRTGANVDQRGEFYEEEVGLRFDRLWVS